MTDQVERIVKAHGGGRWSQVGKVMACVNMGGWDFTSRLQLRPLRDAEVTVTTAEPAVSVSPYPRPGAVGHFSLDRVAIEDDDGRCLLERAAPGDVFRSLRHWLSWDELDVLYYAGLVLWETLNLPFLLCRSDIELNDIGTWRQGDIRWQRLNLRCPPELPALSREQTLFSDAAGLLQRLDYNGTPYGSWMGVSQCFEKHESFQGLVYPTRQTLHPRLMNGQVWRLTALVWLELDDISTVPVPNHMRSSSVHGR